MKYIITLGDGLEEIKFGMFHENVTGILGSPDEKDVENEEGIDSEMWIYDDLQLTLFFEGNDEPELVCIETNHPDTTLFGQKIFELNENEIITMMQKSGGKELDVEDEAWGERRVSFDDAMIDFYFENGKLSTVNWSIDDDEED
jgi:hypothetical protein